MSNETVVANQEDLNQKLTKEESVEFVELGEVTKDTQGGVFGGWDGGVGLGIPVDGMSK